MNKKKIAFIINKKQDISSVINTLMNKNFIVDVFSKSDDIENSTYYDVIFVHESFLETFKRNQFSNSAVIILTNDISRISELFPKITNKNIHTIIPLPINDSKVMRYIEEAIQSLISKKTRQSNSSEGKSIIISSFGNGSGKSLVAYNLAAKLAQFYPDNTVCLVDMNKPLSISKAMLNIDDAFSWQTLQPLLQEGTVDKQKIANSVYLTKYRFSVLSGPTDLNRNDPLSLKEFINLETSLKKIFKVVIYDFYTIENEQSFDIIDKANIPLMILDLNSVTMLQTIRGIQFLKDRNHPVLEKLLYVVNRIDDAKGRSADIVSSRLGIDTFGIIDNDPDAVISTIQNGQLFEDKTLLVDKQLFTLSESLIKEFLSS